jgi:hypothetical protein
MPKQKDPASHLPVCCSSLRYKLLNITWKLHFSPKCTTNILQTLDQGIIRSFKHYYYKQLEIKSISMIDHTSCFMFATLKKLNALDAQLFIAESWCSATHTKTVNCFQKCKKFRFHCIQSLSACLSITLFVSPKWHIVGK